MANSEPLIPSRTTETEHKYRRGFLGLQRKISRLLEREATLLDVADWLCNEHENFKSNTIYQYRAYITQQTKDCISRDEISNIAGSLILSKLNFKRSNKNSLVPSRTSNRKRKSVHRNDFEQVLAKLRNRGKREDILLADLLEINVQLYLRPIEFQTAQLKGTDLHVKSAKTTNGRGTGEFRVLALEKLSDEVQGKISELLAGLQALAETPDEWKKVWARLSARLARTCRRLNIKRLCLYTTRHLGIASARRALSSEEVAGNAGHKTTRTAAERYAHKSIGWDLEINVRPHRASLVNVGSSPKATNMERSIDGAPQSIATRILADQWIKFGKEAKAAPTLDRARRFLEINGLLKQRPDLSKALTTWEYELLLKVNTRLNLQDQRFTGPTLFDADPDYELNPGPDRSALDEDVSPIAVHRPSR